MNILELKPNDTPDYLIPAWLGCISWAVSTKEITDAFYAESNLPPLAQLGTFASEIDKACGLHESTLKAFIEWVNINYWGDL
ncbi:MAG: hypothetical protein ACKO96_05020 [Flammeovirgaceae bacterium]